MPSSSSSSSSSQYFSFITIFLLICFSTFSSHLCSAGAHKELKDDATLILRTDKITKALSDAGYNAMSLTLQITLPTLVSSHHTNTTTTAFTIFCPSDEAFFSLTYPQPPLTLLQYHVSPTKLEKASLSMEEKTSPPTGTKIDTLLPHHPLVVTTTVPADQSGKISINGVEIKQWEVYNDGVVIVHGIDDFFDPAYQTILYPWFDGVYTSKYNSSVGVDASSMEEDNINAGFLAEKWLLGIVVFGVVLYVVFSLVVGLVTVVFYAMLYACGYVNLSEQRGDGYTSLGSSTSISTPDIDSVV